MPRRHAVIATLAGLVLLSSCVVAALVLIDTDPPLPASPAPGRIPVAVLGDSDSHSFHDTVYYPPGSPERGGAFRATTYNWPEVLAHLRSEQLDLGAWGTWGPRKPIALARQVLGMQVRRPRKQDYRYNFAINGARCRDMLEGWRQVDRLLVVMDAQPDYWRDGIVIVRIGVNSFGTEEMLQEMAGDAKAATPRAEIAGCLRAIQGSVAKIRLRHPQTRFVLAGIFNDAHWAKLLEHWHSPAQLANIDAALDTFDDALRAMAADERIAFFDDRAWFDEHFGGRDAQGMPNYREVTLAGTFKVRNSSGDDPSNGVVADGHAGTAWNGLWATRMVEVMNQRFGLHIPPITQEEILSLLGPAARPQS